MVDLATYRARIGSFVRRKGIFDMDILRVVGVVAFIGMLLFAAGIEMNPGPFQTDDLSMALLPEKWIASGYRALKSTGNGNCLYNSCSMALCGNESLTADLRHAVADELQTNPTRYGKDHVLVKRFIQEKNLSPDEICMLFHIVLSNTDDESLSTLTIDNIEEYIRAEGLQSFEDRRWSSILHMMALSTVLGRDMQSVYPDIMWNYQGLYNTNMEPAGDKSFHFPENVSISKEKITLFWTRDGNLSQTDHMFVPNHIVPLVLNASDITIVGTSTKRKRQTKLDSFCFPTCAKKQSTNNNPMKPVNTNNVSPVSSPSSIMNFPGPEDDATSDITSVSSIENTHFTPGFCPDIGTLVSRRTELTDEEKFSILNFNILPPTRKVEKGRKYNTNWESKYKWLRYSSSENGAYCAHCFVFIQTAAKHSEFITKPFKDWKNAVGDKRGVIPGHERSHAHINASTESVNFLKVYKGEEKCIKSSLSTAYEDKISGNRHIIKSIIEVIAKLSSRGIPLRGRWKKEEHHEESNFNFFLDWISLYDAKLANHLKNCPKNAQYTSPEFQNEVIVCIGDYVRSSIIRDVSESSFFSIMADETTDASIKEQLSVCIRYVLHGEVREDFIGFVELPKTNAETITEKLVESLRLWNLDLEKWRGKGFDGAATMSGEISGVQARIVDQFPKAKYFTHCKSHCLNLVVVSSCNNVPQIRNFMNTFKELTFFFHNSAKRKFILNRHMAQKGDVSDLLADLPGCEDKDKEQEDYENVLFADALKRQTLPTLSDTRWLSRIDSLSTLLVHYSNIYDALTDVMEQSTGQSAADAMSFLKSLESFEFIVVGCITQHVLSFIRPLSLNLQDKQCDLLKSHNEATNILESLQSIRANDDYFKTLFERANRIATNIDVIPQKPRHVGRQRHRPNAGDSGASIYEYFRLNHFNPFLDHVIQHFQTRFPRQLGDVLKGTLLLPGNREKLDGQECDIKEIFTDDLPNASQFDTEVIRWRNANKHVKSQTTLQDALLHCDKLFYPNIYSIFELILSLPVGSCTCERSFSALRRLKTWSRSSMTDTRLNGISLMYIHKGMHINIEDILELWYSGGNRRIILK